MVTYRIPATCCSHIRTTRRKQTMWRPQLQHCMWWQKISNIIHVWEIYKVRNLTERRKELIAVSTSPNLYSAAFFRTNCHISLKLMFTNYHISNSFIFKYISINYYCFPARILLTFINLQYPIHTINIYFMFEIHFNTSFYCW